MLPKNTKILVVDDMSTMRRIVKNSLKEIGYENLVDAKNVELAWNIVQEAQQSGNPVDVIFCDWNMPVVSGLELLKKIRSEKDTVDLPFIMLTAKSDERDLAQAEDVGVTAYMTKPFSKEELENQLSQLA